MKKQSSLFVFAAAVLWGTTGTAQALAPQGAQPLAIGALRLVIGALFLWIYAAFVGNLRQLNVTRQNALPILGAGLCMAAYQVLFFAGVKLTGVAIGTLIGIGSSPIIAGILAFLFRKERPGWAWGAATLLTVTGCGLLAITGRELHTNPWGILLAIGAGGAYALFSLLSKGLLEEMPTQQVMALTFGVGALMLSPLLLTQDLHWLLQPRGWIAALHLGVIATGLAYILFGAGLKHIPVATAVTLSMGEPFTAALLGILVLGEHFSLLTGLGVSLIFGGLVILSLQNRRSGEPAPA
jgi:DME family drug/metabolite transporter